MSVFGLGSGHNFETRKELFSSGSRNKSFMGERKVTPEGALL